MKSENTHQLIHTCLKLDFWLFKNRNIMFEELNIHETIHLHISHFLNIFLSFFGQSKEKFQAQKIVFQILGKKNIRTPNVKVSYKYQIHNISAQNVD
jgi:hypothetical protein